MAAKNQRGTTAAVLKHFLSYPGEHVTVEELAEEIGNGITTGQVAAAVKYAIDSRKLAGLRVVQGGHVWVYEPEGNDMPKWALIGHASDDGVVVLEDEDGHLWAAKKIVL